MKTRIRYSKVTGDTLVSKDFYPTDIGNVRVVLETLLLRFKLTEVETGKVLGEGEGKTLSDLKIVVKKHLSSLGVVFGKEGRVRTPSATKDSSAQV